MEFIDTNVLEQDFVEFPTETSSKAYLYEYIAKADVSAVLLVGVDNFKYINGCYGHEFGDSLLKHIGSELAIGAGDCGKVFRLGGDEFAVVVDRCAVNEIITKARRFMKKVEAGVFSLGGFEVSVTICIGAYIPEKSDEPAEEMIRKADIALFKAKSSGRSQLAFYDRAMDEEIKRKLLLTSEMRKGIKENEFFVHYQPIFDINEGKISEVEALLRWESRTFGSVSPAEFIPVAEENGLIGEIGYFVMESVFKQVKRWENEGMRIKVAINISPAQLLNKSVISRLKQLIRKSDIDYKQIKFEITETQILKDEKRIVKFLRRMLKAGLDISLDDFGVGFSSIRNMILFPVSEVKIDKCFTDKLLHDEKTEVIVESIIRAAKKSGYKITAEGVETQKQFNKFRDMGCDKIQGYYISKPMPPEGITNFIRSFQI